ncbi:MAG: SAM-dependent methyltransferase [Bacteriovoracaceae bacterium]
MERTVHTADAIEWLRSQNTLTDCSLVGSLPDISEFPGVSLDDWKKWFMDTARLILSKTPDEGVSFFFQSDIKVEGHWVDKAFLVQKAAEELGHPMLFHKIVCRYPVGTITMGRPAYSHVVAFSKSVVPNLNKWSADVLPDTGEKTWERGMGLDVSLMIAKFVKDQTKNTTIVNPFCGQGSMLAAANHLGLNAIGIERSPKRAEAARLLQVSTDGRHFVG